MDRYTLIESYLMDVLSQADKEAFEMRMSQEKDLRADVESHAKMKVAMDVLVASDVKRIISNSEIRNQKSEDKTEENSEFRIHNSELKKVHIDNQTPDSKTIGIGKRRQLIGIAASVLVLVCLGWWGVDKSLGQSLGPDEAFEMFYNPLKSESTRSGSDGINGEKDAIYLIFKEVDNLIADKKYDEVSVLLSNIQLPKDHRLEDNQSWLMALVKLKIDPSEAKNDFEKLAQNPEHKYAKKIKKLLKKLK